MYIHIYVYLEWSCVISEHVETFGLEIHEAKKA